jgi:small redox-active disulfide protein 2
MDIKVLGTGCAKCKRLEDVTQDAVDQLGIDATVEKVEDIMKIMEYGIMRTPGLVIDGKVVLSGEVPKLEIIKDLLTNN